jgi:hypothetical protein
LIADHLKPLVDLFWLDNVTVLGLLVDVGKQADCTGRTSLKNVLNLIFTIA